jgi:hypothetical protein
MMISYLYSPFLGPEDLCRCFPKYEYMVYLSIHALAVEGGNSRHGRVARVDGRIGI